MFKMFNKQKEQEKELEVTRELDHVVGMDICKDHEGKKLIWNGIIMCDDCFERCRRLIRNFIRIY